MQEELREIDILAIQVSPFQPRRHFSEVEIEELANSIKSIGLIHPPVVREIKGSANYELVAGERRWRSALQAGLSRINVIVKEIGVEDAAKATLIENVQRVDLDPIEIALAFRRLIDHFCMTQEELSGQVGKKGQQLPTIFVY